MWKRRSTPWPTPDCGSPCSPTSPSTWRTAGWKTGLLDRFEVRTGGDEAGRAKPDPAGITLTCAQLGIDATATAYVGDSEQDMLAARAAGSLAVGAAWGSLWRDDHPADVVVRFPEDLPLALATRDMR